jgi:hypothetical protein
VRTAMERAMGTFHTALHASQSRRHGETLGGF